MRAERDVRDFFPFDVKWGLGDVGRGGVSGSESEIGRLAGGHGNRLGQGFTSLETENKQVVDHHLEGESRNDRGRWDTAEEIIDIPKAEELAKQPNFHCFISGPRGFEFD